MASTRSNPPDGAERRPLDSTVALLERIRGGDAAAREALLARFLPIMRSWASGRLPSHARGQADTDDLVQITLVRALNNLEAFEVRHDGAFLAYLRQGVLNAIRQEIRRSSRRPGGALPDESLPDPSRSAVEETIGRETLDVYEAALMELTEDQRHAAILRLEFDLTYPEIAEAMGKPSANAARMLVVRALVLLSERLGERID
jgi:RNA polymerase sigma-70 factor, ECF subfamily